MRQGSMYNVNMYIFPMHLSLLLFSFFCLSSSFLFVFFFFLLIRNMSSKCRILKIISYFVFFLVSFRLSVLCRGFLAAISRNAACQDKRRWSQVEGLLRVRAWTQKKPGHSCYGVTLPWKSSMLRDPILSCVLRPTSAVEENRWKKRNAFSTHPPTVNAFI